MQTADQIIEALGNTTAVASALGLTPSTVQSWKEANFIPEWRRERLIAFASGLRVQLAASDFPTVAQRRSRSDPRPDDAARAA